MSARPGFLVLSLAAKRKGDITAALTYALTSKLETLKSRPFEDGALSPGEHAEIVRGEPGDCLIAEEWTVADDGDGMKRIGLRVRRVGRPGPETAAIPLRFAGPGIPAVRKGGFSLVECLLGMALSLLIIVSSLQFFGQAQKAFFRLKEREEAGQGALAALDKMRVDLLHAGGGWPVRWLMASSRPCARLRMSSGRLLLKSP